MPAITFHPRRSVEQVEEASELAPKFGEDGLVTCVTTYDNAPNPTRL